MADDSESRLTTGIEELDRELDDGILPGTVVAFTAPPESQAEVFFEELARTRPTVVLSTYRSQEQVLQSFRDGGVNTSGKAVKSLFIGESSNPIQKVVSVTDKMSGQGNVLVDSADFLENAHTKSEYLSGLRNLKDNISAVGGVAFLNCHEGQDEELRNLTYAVSDMVMLLSQRIEGEELELRLSVPKYRGGIPPKDTVKLRITDNVAVDTSRDIA